MKLVNFVSCGLLLASLVACAPTEEQKPSVAATEVGYMTMVAESVPYSVELRGRVVALATAEVRPQVNGIIQKIAFSEGREVEAGDILYEIDSRKFAAAVTVAEAALKKAEAATVGAQATFDRNKTLAETQAVSTQTLDDAQSTLLQARASEESAKADLEIARINLENTMIRAPIGGMIGVSSVSVGALVTENQTDALATIRKIEPVNVDLADTSANLLRIREEVDAGKLQRQQGGPMPASLELETGKIYEHKGEVSLADMVVGETTGTFKVRATFPNPERILVPGMFVTARIELGSLSKAYRVPQRALTRGDDGSASVYLVVDGKARLQTVSTGGTVDNDWIVVDGLKDGDQLIVDGFQKISDGGSVDAVEATIDDDGVVEQILGVESNGKSEDSK
jgi:membrane fusion protein (multidrug efflux system)